MGAYTEIFAFDSARHRRLVVPALHELLRSGQLAAELQPIFEAQWAASQAAEARHAAFYQHHPKGSEQLAALQAGLGLEINAVCHCLDQELGLRHSSLAELAEARPDIAGGCHVAECAAKGQCPFHRHCGPVIAPELLMALFQSCVNSSVVEYPPPITPGRHFQLHGLEAWYGHEAGVADEAAEAFFRASQDELPLLLARLCKRGAIWGWASGGFGEGLLGWLNPEESLRLVAALEPYALEAEAPWPAGLDPYTAAEILPRMRQALAGLRDFAGLCASQGLGLLAQRS